MPRDLRGAALTALLVFLGMRPQNSVAQTSATATAAVYAVVVQGTSAAASRRLDFGILKRNAGTHVVPPTAPSVAFTVSGEPEAGVLFTFPEIVNLHGPEGKSLALTPDVLAWSAVDQQSHGQQLFPSITGGRASLSSKGVVYVWFGGSVHLDSVAVGSYTGRCAVTITY